MIPPELVYKWLTSSQEDEAAVPEEEYERSSALQYQLNRIDKLKQQAADAGIAPELTEPREPAWSVGLNAIDKPKQAVLAHLYGILDEPLKMIHRESRFDVVKKHMDNRINMWDVLRQEAPEMPAITRGVLGFAGEVLVDPLSYVGIGAVRTAAVAGSRALSKAGLAKKADLFKKFVGPADDVVDMAKGLPSARGASAASEGMELVAKNVEQLGKPVSARDAIELELTAASHAYDVLEQMRFLKDEQLLFNKKAELAKHLAGMGRYIKADDVPGLFQKPAISFELNLPFLGHLTGKETFKAPKFFYADPAISGSKKKLMKAYEGAGKAFNPDTLFSKSITLPDHMVHAFKQIEDVASTHLKDLHGWMASGAGKVIAAAEDSKLQPLVQSGKETLAKADKLATDVAHWVKKTFALRSLIGDSAANARLDLISEKAGTSAQSTKIVRELFPEIMDETRDGALTSAATAIDSAAKEGIGDILDKIQKGSDTVPKEMQEDFLKYINDAYAGRKLDPTLLEKFGPLIGDFESMLDEKLYEHVLKTVDPSQADEVYGYAKRATQHFRVLQEQELKLGVGTRFLDFYIPHLYSNHKRQSMKFTAERKYRSVDEAKVFQGLDAEMNLAQLLRWRTQQSLIAQANKRYFVRTAFEEGIPAEQLKALYLQALLGDPDGPGLDYIRRKQVIDIDNIVEQRRTTTDKQKLTAGVETKEFLKKGEDHFDRLDDITLPEPFDQIHDPETLKRTLHMASEYLEQSRSILIQNNIKRADINQAESLFGESAKSIRVDGQDYILPHPVADAMMETVHMRDGLRELANRHPASGAILDVMDAALNFNKRFVTLPWPQYWVGNMIGDSFFRLFDGGLQALDPGLYGEVLGALHGHNAIKTATGILPANEFKNILTKYGVEFSLQDLIQTVGAAGKMNLKNYRLKSAHGGWDNLKMGHPIVALEQAQDKVRGGFENFFRITQVAHHLKRGDNVPDAVRLAGEAMINYRDLTPAEQSLFRRFYMFYGWISKSTKKALRSLITSPRDLQIQIKGAKGVAEFFTGENPPPTFDQFESNLLKSVSANEEISFPLGKGVTGRGFNLPLSTPLQSFSVFWPRNMSPDELENTLDDSFTRTLQKQFASSNPVIKAMMEKISGKNLYFDRPLDSEFLRKVPKLSEAIQKIVSYPFDKIPLDLVDAPIKSFLKGVDDGQGNFIADPGRMWLLTFLPGIQRGIATARVMNDDKVNGPLKALRALTGLKIETFEPERTYAYAQEEELRRLLNRVSAKQRIKAAQ